MLCWASAGTPSVAAIFFQDLLLSSSRNDLRRLLAEQLLGSPWSALTQLFTGCRRRLQDRCVRSATDGVGPRTVVATIVPKPKLNDATPRSPLGTIPIPLAKGPLLNVITGYPSKPAQIENKTHGFAQR
jgi:hypothetical protein